MNADGYTVTISASSSTANDGTFDITSGTTHTFTDDFNRGETVTVTIVPYNSVGTPTATCAAESFTIIPPPVPACTTLSGTTTDLGLQPTITWDASTGADGYTLTIAASSSTANNGTITITGTSHSFLNDFEQGETVDVTIVPYNDQGPATGCTAETITIKALPNCNSLLVPEDEDVNVPVDTGISWTTPVGGATGYKLSVTGSSIAANNVSEDISGNSFTFPEDFAPGETITVTLIPYNEIGEALNCDTESFTIKPLPECTNLTLPVEDIDVAVNTHIEWRAINDANGYLVTVEANTSTVNNNTYDVTGNTYDLPGSFEQGETVTVTIIPYNEVGQALGCTSESFTIKSVPLCTNLTSPMDEDIIVSVSEITWDEITDADGYKLTVSGSNSTANDITDFVITDTTYTFPNSFIQGEMVTVTITPYNEVGDAIGCTSESFTIRPLPECTNLATPLNRATEVGVTTDITWIAATDADGYRISVGTSPDGTDIVNDEDVASLTSYTFAEDLPSEATIYVTIVPYNTSGDALGCTWESFETEVIVPDCTALSNPANGETEVPLESTITWDTVEKTDGYRISLGTTPGGTDIVANFDAGQTTSYYHGSELPYGTEIFVTITPYNIKGGAVQCVEQSFTTLVPEDDTKYGFSPDGDGINEYWHIDNIEYYPENMVTIYNRWGDLVFQIENYDNASNVFRGEANRMTQLGADNLPSGTYFFTIQVPNDNILKKTKGYVVIKR